MYFIFYTVIYMKNIKVKIILLHNAMNEPQTWLSAHAIMLHLGQLAFLVIIPQPETSKVFSAFST